MRSRWRPWGVEVLVVLVAAFEACRMARGFLKIVSLRAYGRSGCVHGGGTPIHPPMLVEVATASARLASGRFLVGVLASAVR